MMTTLASLDEALMENARLMAELLQQQRYDEALLCMDDRLALIACLAQQAKDDPTKQPEIATLAARVATQEESIMALATQHHQAIFKQLTQVGKISKAEHAYRVNSKEY